MRPARLAPLCLALLLLAGCAGGNTADECAQEPAEVTPQYVEAWPDNDFTAALPEPEAGEVEYVCDLSGCGRFEIVMKDMPDGGAEAYIETLKRAGFAEKASAENDVSGGVLLQKDGVSLSIAWSGTGMNVLIKK
ncbi:MAG: hypothetical protein IK136_03460 [Oscillospiraceae bacterium]|nr:hypothetical protein [Oscillospiraceae bacterium]